MIVKIIKKTIKRLFCLFLLYKNNFVSFLREKLQLFVLFFLFFIQILFLFLYFSIPLNIEKSYKKLNNQSNIYDFVIDPDNTFKVNNKINIKESNFNFWYKKILQGVKKKFPNYIESINIKHIRNFEKDDKAFKFIAYFSDQNLKEKEKDWNLVDKLILEKESFSFPKIEEKKDEKIFYINFNSKYAQENNLKIGQEINIEKLGWEKNKEIFNNNIFKINGFSKSIGTIFPIFSEIRRIPDTKKEAIIWIDNSAFGWTWSKEKKEWYYEPEELVKLEEKKEKHIIKDLFKPKLPSDQEFYFIGKLKKGINIDQAINEINHFFNKDEEINVFSDVKDELQFVYKWNDKTRLFNFRIITINEFLKIYKIISWFILLIVFFTNFNFLIINTKKKLNQIQKNFYYLKAYGYSKKTIIYVYLLNIFSILIPAFIIAIFTSFIVKNYIFQSIFNTFFLLKVNFSFFEPFLMFKILMAIVFYVSLIIIIFLNFYFKKKTNTKKNFNFFLKLKKILVNFLTLSFIKKKKKKFLSDFKKIIIFKAFDKIVIFMYSIIISALFLFVSFVNLYLVMDYKNNIKSTNPYQFFADYDSVVYNSPLSAYRVYDPKLNVKYLLSDYFKDDNKINELPDLLWNQYYSPLDFEIDQKENISIYPSFAELILMETSVLWRNISSDIIYHASNLNKLEPLDKPMEEWMCNFLYKGEIKKENNWKINDCFIQGLKQKLPASFSKKINELTKNIEYIKNNNIFFDLYFGIVPFNKDSDILITSSKSKINNDEVSIYGINEKSLFGKSELFSKNNELDSEDKVIINQTLAKKENLKIGSYFWLEIKQEVLADYTNNQNGKEIKLSDWDLNWENDENINFNKIINYKKEKIYYEGDNEWLYIDNDERNLKEDFSPNWFKYVVKDKKIKLKEKTIKKRVKVVNIEENYEKKRIFIDKKWIDKWFKYDELEDWWFKKYYLIYQKWKSNFLSFKNLKFNQKNKRMRWYPFIRFFQINENLKEDQIKEKFSQFFPIFNSKFSNFQRNERYVASDYEDGIIFHNLFGDYSPSTLQGNKSSKKFKDIKFGKSGVKNYWVKDIYFDSFNKIEKLIIEIIMIFIFLFIIISFVSIISIINFLIKENIKFNQLLKIFGSLNKKILLINFLIYLPNIIFASIIGITFGYLTVKIFIKWLNLNSEIIVPFYFNIWLFAIIMLIISLLIIISFFTNYLFIDKLNAKNKMLRS
jgi:hypothetical protein